MYERMLFFMDVMSNYIICSTLSLMVILMSVGLTFAAQQRKCLLLCSSSMLLLLLFIYYCYYYCCWFCGSVVNLSYIHLHPHLHWHQTLTIIANTSYISTSISNTQYVLLYHTFEEFIKLKIKNNSSPFVVFVAIWCNYFLFDVVGNNKLFLWNLSHVVTFFKWLLTSFCRAVFNGLMCEKMSRQQNLSWQRTRGKLSLSGAGGTLLSQRQLRIELKYGNNFEFQ